MEQTSYLGRLTLLYKIVNNLPPDYTMDPIPQLHQSHYSLRKRDVVGRVMARTDKFKSSFYPHCLCEWNDIEPEIRLTPSVAVFKKKILSTIHPPPPANSVFGIHDPIGPSFLTPQIQKHFWDTVNPMCLSNDGIEGAEHFLLLCPSFDAQRRDLLAGVYDVLRPFGHSNLSNKVLTQLLLYGDEKFSCDLNRTIFNLTIQFIRKTGRFE